MQGHDGALFFGGGFMWLIWIVLIVVIVAMVKAIVFSETGNIKSGVVKSEKSAIEILKDRYARGEMDDAEFQRRIDEIEK